MRYLSLLLISLLLSNCAINKNRLTDLEKIGLTGKVKYLKFNNQDISKNQKSGNEPTQHQDEGEGVFVDNEFLFNKNGMISEQRQYSSNELTQIYKFSYDKKNRLISKDYYNASMELVAKSKFENILNNKGKLIKQTEFRTLGNPLSDTTSVKYSLFPYQITKYLYDGHGNLRQFNQYQSFSPYLKEITEYKNGRMIKYSIVDLMDDSFTGSSYYKCMDFDQEHNCIKYKIIGEDHSESYTKVKIEYYK